MALAPDADASALDADDLDYIQRLQAVRESGDFNMFMEVHAGLLQHYARPKADSTYQWIEHNFEYYAVGAWTEVDVAAVRERLA